MNLVYNGTSPEGYSDWLAWAACEVDDSNLVEDEDDWVWRENIQCYERKEN